MGLEDEPMESPLEREIVRPNQALAMSTANGNAAKKPPPFKASGSLGVQAAAPVASTSKTASEPLASTSTVSTPAAVGSGLAAGATVTVVKRQKKERGRMRELIGAVGKGKGKGKAQEVESEVESEFDSSEASSDDDGDGLSEAASWNGIEEPEGGSQESASEESGSEDDETDAADTAPSGEGGQTRKREKGSFQAWAESQVLAAAGLEDEAAHPSTEADDGTYKPLLPAGSGFKNKPDPEGITGPLGATIAKSVLPTLPPQRTTNVPVERTEAIAASRMELPIVKEEDRIMDAIRGNAVTVLCGETGSGKTTQIGQFLWEAGFGDPSSGESCLSPTLCCQKD